MIAYIAEHSVVEEADGWTRKFDPYASASLSRETGVRRDLFGQTVPVDILYGELTELMGPDRVALAHAIAPDAGGTWRSRWHTIM